MLARGERLTEILKQDQYAPAAHGEAGRHHLRGHQRLPGRRTPCPQRRRYEEELYRFLDTRHPELLKEMAEKKDIKGELTDKLKAALEEFAGVFQAEPAEKAS